MRQEIKTPKYRRVRLKLEGDEERSIACDIILGTKEDFKSICSFTTFPHLIRIHTVE
jgi:hypothetical protein